MVYYDKNCQTSEVYDSYPTKVQYFKDDLEVLKSNGFVPQDMCSFVQKLKQIRYYFYLLEIFNY